MIMLLGSWNHFTILSAVIKLKLYFLFVLILPTFTLNGQSDWDLATDEDGIQVYTRPVEGSNYREFKAIMEVDASKHALLAVFKSVDEMSTWLPKCQNIELLEKDNFWHQVIYNEIHVPILQNRDMVLEMNITHDDLTSAIRIDMANLPDLIPEKRKKTRIREARGYWLCQPTANGRLRIEYSLFLDPGRGIPSWLYNRRLKSDPFETLAKLREVVQDSEYAGAFFTEVAELEDRQ